VAFRDDWYFGHMCCRCVVLGAGIISVILRSFHIIKNDLYPKGSREGIVGLCLSVYRHHVSKELLCYRRSALLQVAVIQVVCINRYRAK
jgi:hypothetical protein